MQNYEGIIIEESLENIDPLKQVRVISTEIEPTTEGHKTPWVKQWTMHTVEIPADNAVEIAASISKALDSEHNWYADFKTETDHLIIFRNKVFHITDRTSKEQYAEASQYGMTLGIPDYQLDFSPHIKQWDR